MIIPNAPLSDEEAEDRLRRHHLLVAYRDNKLVGNITVRPPAADSTTATVIVRVLPQYRRRGVGQQLFERAMAEAYAMGAREIETCVLAANVDGLQFAQTRGFVEIDRYTLPGDDQPFVDLRLQPSPDTDGPGR